MRFGGLVASFDGETVDPELLARWGTVDLLSNWRTATRTVRTQWKTAAKEKELGLNSPELTAFGGAFTLVERLISDRRISKQYAVYFNPFEETKKVDDLEYVTRRLGDAGIRAELVEFELDNSSFEVAARDTELVANLVSLLEQFPPGIEALVMPDVSGLGVSVEGYSAAALLVGRYAAQHQCSVYVSGGEGDTWVGVISAVLDAIARMEEGRNASDAGTGEDSVAADADS